MRIVLIALNGAPAVGKTTLARRYADEHPLALVVDIDMIRTHLGRWAELDESRLVARDLAVALIRAHLLTGRDAIVPQYLGRPEFLDRLRHVAAEMNAGFIEVVLTDEIDEIAQRFRRRRAEYAASGVEHPESDLGDDAVVAELRDANERLLRDATARRATVVSVTRGPDAAYHLLCEALASLP